MVIIVLIVLLVPWNNFFTIPMLGDISLVYLVAFFIFVIASISDYFDGYLARKYHLVSNFGKFMDPIADKMLVNSLLIVLLLNQAHSPNHMTVPLIAVIIMIARDLVVDGLRLVASERNIVLAANIFGKLKTVFQMVAISLVLLNDWPFTLIYGSQIKYVSLVLIWLAAATSLLSGIIYVAKNFQVLKENKHE